MAKSERKSKWKKKFRAIRREKCKKKDLLILSSILAQKCSPPVETRPPRDSNKMEASAADSIETQVKDEPMLADTEAKIYNSKTKRDKNGNYPVWMNQRSIKKLKKRLNPKKK